MRAIFTIVHLTLHEAFRRRVLLATLIGAAAFLILYGIGFHFVAKNLHEQVGLTVLQQRLLLELPRAGRALRHALPHADDRGAAAGGHALGRDQLGRRADGGEQAGASLEHRARQVARLLAGGGGVLPHCRERRVADRARHRRLHATGGAAGAAAHGARSGGVRVALDLRRRATRTVTNGILAFGLYGIAFIGCWVEQIGVMAGNRRPRTSARSPA